MKNEGLYIAILVGVVVLVAVLGAVAARQTPNVIQLPGTGSPTKPAPVEPPTEQPVPNEPQGITQAACEDAGGTFDECGSACRGAGPDTMCILMCVQYCYCESDAQCPTGYSCGDYLDKQGICEKSS